MFGNEGTIINSVARSLAGAATRSLIEGTDFGDNIIATLPTIIGSTIGNFVAGRITGRGKQPRLDITGGNDGPIDVSGVLNQPLDLGIPSLTGAGDGTTAQPTLGVGGGQVGGGAVQTARVASPPSTFINAATGGIEHVGNSHNEVEWIAARWGDPMASAAGEVEGFLTTYGYETTLEMLLANAPDARVTSSQLFSLAERNGPDSATAALASAYYANSGLRAEDAAFDSLLGRGNFALDFPAGEQLAYSPAFQNNGMSAAAARIYDPPIGGGGFVFNVLFDSAITMGVGGAYQLGKAAIGGVVSRLAAGITERGLGRISVSPDLKYGTTLFGREAHVQAGTLLQARLEAQGITGVVNRTGPGLRGVDMSVPRAFEQQLGFRHIEIKPNTASGLKTFNTQVRNWGYDPATVRAVTYDAQGNLRWGFDF
jgi:hypothetical protein